MSRKISRLEVKLVLLEMSIMYKHSKPSFTAEEVVTHIKRYHTDEFVDEVRGLLDE